MLGGTHPATRMEFFSNTQRLAAEKEEEERDEEGKEEMIEANID